MVNRHCTTIVEPLMEVCETPAETSAQDGNACPWRHYRVKMGERWQVIIPCADSYVRPRVTLEHIAKDNLCSGAQVGRPLARHPRVVSRNGGRRRYEAEPRG
jgi:hypothetical protein